jgi:hypothetical protein
MTHFITLQKNEKWVNLLDETSYYGPMQESIYEMNYMNKYWKQ